MEEQIKSNYIKEIKHYINDVKGHALKCHQKAHFMHLVNLNKYYFLTGYVFYTFLYCNHPVSFVQFSWLQDKVV